MLPKFKGISIYNQIIKNLITRERERENHTGGWKEMANEKVNLKLLAFERKNDGAAFQCLP